MSARADVQPVRPAQGRQPLLARGGAAKLRQESGGRVEILFGVDDGPDLDARGRGDLARADRADLEVLALVHEPGRLVERAGGGAVVADLQLDLVASAQPPLGDGGVQQQGADASPAEALADEEVAHPALEGGVVQAPSEPMDDEAGRRPAVGEREERRGVDVADEGLERRAMRLRVGIGVEAVELACERERIGEVVTAEGPEVHAVRPRDREAADRAVGVAEGHARVSRR